MSVVIVVLALDLGGKYFSPPLFAPLVRYFNNSESLSPKGHSYSIVSCVEIFPERRAIENMMFQGF